MLDFCYEGGHYVIGSVANVEACCKEWCHVSVNVTSGNDALAKKIYLLHFVRMVWPQGRAKLRVTVCSSGHSTTHRPWQNAVVVTSTYQVV
jgi:hypothetical protein